jgi:polysaccharide export outer membrane protein
VTFLHIFRPLPVLDLETMKDFCFLRLPFALLGCLLMCLSVLPAHAGGGDGPIVVEPVPANNSNGALSSYRIGIGDVVSIRIFGEDDLSREKIKLTDAGTVPYPILGEVRVVGMTVGELERRIADGFRGRYLVNPRVTVLIDEYRPYYINGQVERTGAYPYQPGMTIRKAGSLAGGFKERASLSKIFVIREADPQHRSEKVDLDSPIYPGDVVTVEESFF